MQLERKRHVGNDVTVVVFVDGAHAPGAEPFDTSIFTSEMNHVFIIVTALPKQPTDARRKYQYASILSMLAMLAIWVVLLAHVRRLYQSSCVHMIRPPHRTHSFLSVV